MKACEICGPEKNCSKCRKAEDVKIEGERKYLVVALLDMYIPYRITRNLKEDERTEVDRGWLARTRGWDTADLAEMRKELAKFKSPGH